MCVKDVLIWERTTGCMLVLTAIDSIFALFIIT